MSLSDHKDVFGEPGTGIHGYRVADVAVLDVLGTAGVSYGISKVTGFGFWKTFLGVFIAGEAMHHAFGVDTKVMRLMGFNHSAPESDSDQKRKCPMSAFQ